MYPPKYLWTYDRLLVVYTSQRVFYIWKDLSFVYLQRF